MGGAIVISEEACVGASERALLKQHHIQLEIILYSLPSSAISLRYPGHIGIEGQELSAILTRRTG